MTGKDEASNDDDEQATMTCCVKVLLDVSHCHAYRLDVWGGHTLDHRCVPLTHHQRE